MRLGDSELQLLKYIQDSGPSSVRQVADEYGEAKGLARTTVQTVMERLRKKGFLEREEREGSFVYSARQGKERTLHDSIDSFVKNTLGGSIAPIASYFANAKNLTPEEVEMLRSVVEKLGEDGKS
ncbi:MAG: BlaI/MecI/CopY family transcriptional regulator [Armatimonadetes bacterium]|nr:BlaI/MecI/CopY family transcriptional regulator [Armatimonadota bacterium]